MAGVAVLVSLTELGYLVVAMIGCRRIGVVAWKSDLAITAFGAVYLMVCKLLYDFALQSFHGMRVAAIAVVVMVTAALTFGLIKRSKLL